MTVICRGGNKSLQPIKSSCLIKYWVKLLYLLHLHFWMICNILPQHPILTLSNFKITHYWFMSFHTICVSEYPSLTPADTLIQPPLTLTGLMGAMLTRSLWEARQSATTQAEEIADKICGWRSMTQIHRVPETEWIKVWRASVSCQVSNTRDTAS